MRDAALGEVAAHGADRAAGQLVVQIGGIEALRPAGRQALGLGEAGEVAGHCGQRLVVDVDAMPERAQVGDDAFDGRIRDAVRGRARGALQRADAELRRVQVGQLREPDGVVRVQLERLVAPASGMAALIAGISVAARFCDSSPPGSLMYSASTSGLAASVRAQAA